MQDWDDQEFCDRYELTWEITTDEVHFGWLAEGESTLNLLSDIKLNDSVVLDAGCGMGQNLLALSKRGAIGYGVDISPCMISKAESLCEELGFLHQMSFNCEDMRTLSSFDGVDFDLILAVYSMEYLTGIQEFRKTIYRFFQRLKAGGHFVFCYTHPTQIKRHPRLLNSSISTGENRYSTVNYSFRDVVDALCKTGFEILRIVEQSTINPSDITYEDSLRFPYHFHHGMNPCKPEFDDISNKHPHTIIYKVRKPDISYMRLRPKAGEKRNMWGYSRKIIGRDKFVYQKDNYNIEYLSKMDNVVAVCDVVSIKFRKEIILENEEVMVIDVGQNVEFIVPSRSILGVLHRAIISKNLVPTYKMYDLDGGEISTSLAHLLLEKIAGIHEIINSYLPDCNIGLLSFLNDKEPVEGELSLDSVICEDGDIIKLTYVAYKGKDEFDTQLQLL